MVSDNLPTSLGKLTRMSEPGAEPLEVGLVALGTAGCLGDHRRAGGIALDTAVERLRSLTGRIDLVHANDSRDEFGSGADRHTSFGAGKVDHDAFVELVRAAGAPVIAETPGGPDQHGADFAWLRDRL